MAEEGEILEAVPVDYSPSWHDSAYEWPGESSKASLSPYSHEAGSIDSDSESVATSTLRLLVQKSTTLSARIAILEGYEKVEIGRDAAAVETTPRLRLKEMSVSKLHASVYWDSDQFSWAIVDHGSMHGTFVKTANGSAVHRLSPSRTASIPRTVQHLDMLVVGGAEFILHIHDHGTLCDLCSVGMDEKTVSLFPKNKSSKPVNIQASFTPAVPKDPKKALSSLKQSLLTRHHRGVSPQLDTAVYVDRSARRRAQYPASKPDAPGSQHTPIPPIRNMTIAKTPYNSSSGSFLQSTSAVTEAQVSWEPPITVSQPAAPLTSTNIGHRLLMKQGWQPGSSLGSGSDLMTASNSASTGTDDDRKHARISLIEPLQGIGTSTRRAGLGMPVDNSNSIPSIAGNGNWIEAGRQRQWDALNRK